MDLTAWKDVCIGSLYVVFISVCMLWFCRWFGTKQNLERVVEPAQDGDKRHRGELSLEPKHKVFLSHSGAQKDFVEQLCVDLERCDRYPFFDRRSSSLPLGRNFPKLIFEAIKQCEVGVVVLSEEFFTLSKWPMLELVAMRKNAKLVIIPVFLGMSLEQYRDPKRQKKWVSIWRGWAGQEKRHGREIDIEEWCGAVRALGPLKSLICGRDSEVSLREKIVKAVCDVVLPETRWQDSHVHGRSRLAKVVCKKIDEAQVSQKYGVPMVGLYGVGGIGKTTICQTLCNEFLTRMQGRVFHAELEGAGDIELLQGALKCLTDKSREFICGLNKSQCQDLLRREMQKQAIFLVIDNISDSTKFIEQVKYFLSVGLNKGSIVVVTSRSLEALKLGFLDIDESNCLEMPELLEDEAKSLFMEHAISCHEVGLEIDEEIISSCLKRCYFQKGVGKSYHYHPLALKVLGTQLGLSKYDKNNWVIALNGIDTFNRTREEVHPIFSILRKSFDILRPEDQMLFMDVALFLPESDWTIIMDMTWFDWLSMVHGTSVDDIIERLGGLKRKSLLQDLGDGRSTKIGMHDLWREFAAMESKAGKFEGRRWVYEVGFPSAVEEGAPSGGCWQNMKRMCFLGEGLLSVEKINLDHFPNIKMMKIGRDLTDPQPFNPQPFKVRDSFRRRLFTLFDLRDQPFVNIMMDMQNLKHLKSMELFGVAVEVVGLGLMANLCFLKLRTTPTLSEAVVDDIERLTNLRVLVLADIGGERVPDVSKLLSLEEVHFFDCSSVATISGFSSRLSKLRILDLSRCWKLRSLGPGVGDLVALQELHLRYCYKLEELPNLQKLTSLRTLSINGCCHIKSVPGLDDLVALEQLLALNCRGIVELPNLQKLTMLRTLEISRCCKIKSLPGLGELVALRQLQANECGGLAKVPDMRKLTNLQVLDLWNCPLESAPGMGVLIALQKLSCDFRQLPQQPDLSRYCWLRDLYITGYDSQEVFARSLVSLSMLEILSLWYCQLGDEVPDCQSLNRLKVVEIGRCDFKDVSALSSCTALETLRITGCRWVERLPDLHKISRLKALSLERCDMLRDVYCIGSLSQLKSVTCKDLPQLTELPDLRYFPQLEEFVLAVCAELVRLECTEPLVSLNCLTVSDCRNLISVPDVSHFPKLSQLRVNGFNSLMELTCTGALTSLETVDLTGCGACKAIRDLSNFPKLKVLRLTGGKSIVELTCAGPVDALGELFLVDYVGLKSIGDMSNFQRLRFLKLRSCESLMELTSIECLTSLETIELTGCHALKAVPDLSKFPQLESLRISACGSLTKLACSGPAAALEELDLGGCQKLNAIPDLVRFPHLKKLCLTGCDSLQDLTCTGPLYALKELNLVDCLRLKAVPDLGNFPGLSSL